VASSCAPPRGSQGRVLNIGSGSGLVALRPAFEESTGRVVCQGEGPGHFGEGVDFRVSSRGIDVSRVVAARPEGDARCASLALSHLSLSLSLFA
jgi:hypothetical protein